MYIQACKEVRWNEAGLITLITLSLSLSLSLCVWVHGCSMDITWLHRGQATARTCKR